MNLLTWIGAAGRVLYGSLEEGFPLLILLAVQSLGLKLKAVLKALSLAT